MSVTNNTNTELARIYRERGNWSQVYLDVSGNLEDPQRREAHRRRQLREGLESAGAPNGDIEAIDSILIEDPGVESPVCRFILVRDGTIELNAVLPGAPVAPEGCAFGPIPDLLPLMRHRPEAFHYVVVEAGRDGGEIQLYSSDSSSPVIETTFEGRTDVIHKAQEGGWAHDKHQRHSEETWRQNTAKLASTVDELVRDHRPRAVILAGDVRASQLLEENLSIASRRLLSTVPTYTRPDGASDHALKQRLAEQLEEIVSTTRRSALDQLANQQGRNAEFGVGEVVHALQQAQVDILLLDADHLRDRELLALDAAPWIAAAPEEALGASVLGKVSAPIALVRAAMMTDAAIRLVSSGELPRNADAAATLRWPTGPATPGE